MRPQIVLFGDSITEQSFRSGGWGASLADNYSRKADIVLRGYGGYTSRWALFLLHHIFPLRINKLIPEMVGIFPSFGLLTGVGNMIHGRTHGLRSAHKLALEGPFSRSFFLGLLKGGVLFCPWMTRYLTPLPKSSAPVNSHNLGSATPPVAATIFFGANDAALLGRNSEKQHVPIGEYKDNLRRIVHHLKECSPMMLVVIITPPPVDEEGRLAYARSLYGETAVKLPERTNEVTGVYAKQCVELAKELGLPSINLWSKMQETEGWQKKFLSDGLHLTPEGNAVVHQEVVRVFNEAGLSAPEMPYDFPHHSLIDGNNPEKAFQLQCIV